MQPYIRTVTQQLLTRITDQQLHFTPKDLLDAGFPDFVVKRIELELQRNLAESVTLPDSDWADMQADPVQDAWDNFLEAIHAETRIPDSYLQSVVENAVEDILELLAEPERYVLDTLFRSEDEVSILELHARRPWIVLNGHLADAVIRYMQRRNMSAIKRDKAANIIRQIDQHLASGYSPLKWAQALDVCYILMGPMVPSALVSRYFADKGLSDIARRMENADEELSRSRLIEYLSMPDLNWDDDDASALSSEPASTSDDSESPSQKSAIFEQEIHKEEESTSQDSLGNLHQNHKEVSPASPQTAAGVTTEESSTKEDALQEDDRTGEDFFAALAESNDDVSDDDNPFNFPEEEHSTPIETQPKTREEIHEPESDEPQHDSILSAYARPDDEQEPDDELENPFTFQDEDDDEEGETPGILAAYAHSTTSEEEHEDEESLEESPSAYQDDPLEELSSDAGNEAVPIWQRFLNADENVVPEDESIMGSSYEPEDGSSEYPPLSDEARILIDRLDVHANIIMDELFNADLNRFYETMNTIATYDNWQQAGKYLTRDVFIPFEIDMYSGEAVLFVDLLQQYFEEKNA